MALRKASKLNYLIQQWPRGAVVVQPWLESQGYSRQLINSYEKHGWLVRIGTGAYILVGDTANWYGAVYALQNGYGYRFHVAAKTAMICLEQTHYLALGAQTNIELMKAPNESHVLPKWMNTYFREKTEFTLYERNLFDDNEFALMERSFDHIKIILSSPERAILECLSLAPKDCSLSYCFTLLEGLNSLRPNIVQALLEQCNSVKVKRLFLLFAEQCNHKWFHRLEFDKINVGSGKRVIGDGGFYYAKYGISLPLDISKDEGYQQDE